MTRPGARIPRAQSTSVFNSTRIRLDARRANLAAVRR